MASVSPQLTNKNSDNTTENNNNPSATGQDSPNSLEQDSNISSSNPKYTSDSHTHPQPRFLCKTTTSDSDSVEVTTKTRTIDHSQSSNINFNTQEDINNYQENSNNIMFSANSAGGINSNNGSTSSNNTSDSSISSSTNPSFSSIAGGVETEFEGPTDLGTNYRAPCVAEDDAGSSSHSEVRSSSPGLVDADADVEDSPSGSEQETGSESERGGTSVMYAPNTVGFPPSRSSLTHTIPTGANFVNTARFVPGSNPFAVKAGSISSSTSGSNSVSNVDYCSSNNSSNGNSKNSTHSFSGNSLSRGGIVTGRWGSCQPQKLSWNSRPIIRPSALGSSLGSAGNSPPPLSSPLSSSTSTSTPNYFNMSSDNAADQSETNTGLSSSSSTSSSFVLRPPKLPFGLTTSSSTSTPSTSTIRASQFSKSILSESSCFSTSKQVTEGPFIGNEVDNNSLESNNLQQKSDASTTNNDPPSSTTSTSNQQNVNQESETNEVTTKPSCIFVPLEKENNNLFESGCSALSTATTITTSTTTNIFSGVNGSSSSSDGSGGDQQIRSFASIGQSVSNISSLSTPSSSANNNTAVSSAQPTSTSTTGSNAGFVFGSNLLQRISNTPGVSTDKTEEQPSNGISSSSSSTSDGLFCAALRNVQGSPLKAASSASGEAINSSNNQFSGDITAFGNSEAQNAERKRKFESGPVVVTGEEDESNVIQISCRLFAFDSVTSSWKERGRGGLRVNDRASNESNDLQSRVIVRSKGSLRVMLNTNVWSDMKVDRTSDKSVRLTANDNGHIRLFLVMATVSECDQLYNAVDWRVRTLKSIEEKQAAAGFTSSSVSEKVDGDDYEDDEPCFNREEEDSDTMKKLSRKRSSSEGLQQQQGGESKLNHSRNEDEDHERASGHDFNDDSSDDEEEEGSNSPSKKKRFLETSSETNKLSGNNLSRQTPTIRINNEECLD